jgi:MFS family permease
MTNVAQKPDWSIWYLAAAIACIGAGQSTIFILIPAEVRSLGFNEFEVGIIFSISAIAWMIFSPFWGRLSDRFGRKWIFLIGIFGFSLSMILFAAIISAASYNLIPFVLILPLLIITRLINGLLGSAVRPAAGGRIADLTSPETRAAGFARFDAGWQMGVVTGPILIGVLLSIFNNNLFIPFLFIALLGISLGFYNFFQMGESDHQFNEEKLEMPRKISMFDSRVWPSLVIASFMGLSNAGLVLTSSIFVKDVILANQSEVYSTVAIGFSIVALASMFSQLVIVQNYKIKSISLIKWGLLIVFLGFLSLSQASSIPGLYLGLMLKGLGMGLARAGNITMLSLSVSKDEQGAANGLLNMVFPIGHILVPVVIMPLYILSPEIPYILLSSLAILLIIFILSNQKRYLTVEKI